MTHIEQVQMLTQEKCEKFIWRGKVKCIVEIVTQ